MKTKVNLGLAKTPVPLKIERARHIVTSMTGNANFATPVPTLASVTTAINNLEIAFNAAQGAGPAQTATMHDKETLLDNLLTQLANYVESTSNGVAAIILSAGMDVKGKGGQQPHIFNAVAGKHTGEAILHAKVTRHASYIWQMTNDPPLLTPPNLPNNLAWHQVGVTTKSIFVVEGLAAGTRYWFRVAIVTKTGQEAWSDPISIIVQ